MKMSILKFILMSILVSFTSSVYSQELEVLHVWMTDGAETALMLNTHPKVTFVSGQMVITSDEQTFEVPYDKVSRFTYSMEELSSIADVRMELRRDSEYVVFPEGTATDDVSVYSSDGRQMSAKLYENGRHAVLSLSSLPKGVYIVKAKNRTFKMTRP